MNKLKDIIANDEDLQEILERQTKFTMKKFNKIFECDDVEFEIVHYCCNGLYESCWVDSHGEGIWGWDKQKVKNWLKWHLTEVKKFLYNTKKYGNRFFMYEKESRGQNYLIMRIVTRDVWGYDISICGQIM